MNNKNNDADDDKRVFYGTLSRIKILYEKILKEDNSRFLFKKSKTGDLNNFGVPT